MDLKKSLMNILKRLRLVKRKKVKKTIIQREYTVELFLKDGRKYINKPLTRVHGYEFPLREYTHTIALDVDEYTRYTFKREDVKEWKTTAKEVKKEIEVLE